MLKISTCLTQTLQHLALSWVVNKSAFLVLKEQLSVHVKMDGI